jgi:hypothetical protein
MNSANMINADQSTADKKGGRLIPLQANQQGTPCMMTNIEEAHTCISKQWNTDMSPLHQTHKCHY